MTDPKPEVHVSQLVDMIESKLKMQIPCFRGRATQWHFHTYTNFTPFPWLKKG